MPFKIPAITIFILFGVTWASAEPGGRSPFAGLGRPSSEGAESSTNRTIRIHYIGSGSNPQIRYRTNGQDQFQTRDFLKSAKNSWAVTLIPADSLEFTLLDSGREINLGGTMGNYSTNPKMKNDPAENFRTTAPEVWVKGGVLYPYDPEGPRGKDYLTILTVNLHTYQETDQDRKFDSVVLAIRDLKPDFVAFQECAQKKDSPVAIENHYGQKIRKDNAAKIISDRLRDKYKLNYDYYWDWSHYGFDHWEEGSAVMSLHPIEKTESRYVSKATNKTVWKSRNIVRITANPNGRGKVSIYSLHMGWWVDPVEPFRPQLSNLVAWQAEDKTSIAVFSIGDFNVDAGSAGYRYITGENGFMDHYSNANPGGFYDPTIGGRIDGWKDGSPEGKRIDYIFTRPGDPLEPVILQRIFTEKSYGRVSDHNGLYGFFKWK